MSIPAILRSIVLCLTVLTALPLPAQQNSTTLTSEQARTLYQRSLQLMESSGFAMPELARAGAPLIENMRQTMESLDFLGYRAAQLHYRMIANLRAFLMVSDAVPKPVPFPDASRRQLAELRDNLASFEVYFQSQIEDLQRSLRAPDRDDFRRYAEANSTLPPRQPGQSRVVFFGDSITDSWRLNEYFPNRDFINRGISGHITSQMLARFLPDVAALKPDAVLILAGTNDIARGTPPSTIQSNLTAIADLADHYKIKPVFASILPVSDYHKGVNPSYERSPQRPLAAIQAMNDWLKQLCARRNYIYLDYFTSLADQAGHLKPDYGDDGLHPNPGGYRVMAPLALAAIEKAVGPAQPEKKKRRLF
jgi:lysophospholipase L1-like esterase